MIEMASVGRIARYLKRRTMTKKAFKYAMQRGLGSCVLELQHTRDIEKYQSIVLWGCSRDMAYDAQCEGCRSFYLYELITQFSDKTPFLDVIEKRLFQSMHSTGWEFAQDSELLAYFALDGNERARKIMENCYDTLFQILLKKRRRKKYGLLPERDNFEWLCDDLINICSNDRTLLIELYKKIVKDSGTLIKENELYSFFSFEQFQSECEERLGKKTVYRLLYCADADDAIKAYVRSMEDDFNERKAKQAEWKSIYPESADEVYELLKNGGKAGQIGQVLPLMYGYNLMIQNKQKEVVKLAAYYKNEKENDVRYNLLKLLANKRCAWALDVARLIADSKSENDDFASWAFNVLSDIRNAKVREYALELLQNGTHRTEALAMLAVNYEETDKDFLINAVKQLPVTYEDGEWHWVFRAVMDIFSDPVKQKPKELLRHMYENTLCSSCRVDIVKEMGRRRMLTKELLEELQYDCNKHIREYAKKKRSRKAPSPL